MQAVKNKISSWSIWHGTYIDDDLWELFMDIDFKLTENIKMPLLGVLSEIDKGEI